MKEKLGKAIGEAVSNSGFVCLPRKPESYIVWYYMHAR